MPNDQGSNRRSISTSKEINIDPVNGIDVNHCKNPRCSSFNAPYTGTSADPNYMRSGTKKATTPYGRKTLKNLGKHAALGTTSTPLFIQCNQCGETPPLKSNHGINEVLKIWDYHPDNDSCPNTACVNHEIPIGTKRAYRRNGSTPAGTFRWRCNACNKSFVERAKLRPSREGEKPYRYEDVIKALVNSSPFNRMMEVYGVTPVSIYRYIEKAYKACVRFNAKKSQKISSILSKRGIVYFSTDRQDLFVNWSNWEDRSAIPIKATCSADAETGFIYRYDVGVDDKSNPKQIHEESIENGDVDVANVFRKYPHVFLPSDIGIEVRINGFIEQELIKIKRDNPFISEVELAYEEAVLRPNIESPSNHITEGTGLPNNCLLIKEDYQLYGHYFSLRRDIPADVKVINFSDQESGLRAAFMSAFADKVMNNDAHLFYISYSKKAVREDRERAKRETHLKIKSTAKTHNCDWEAAKHILCLDAIQNYTSPIGKWRDHWGIHPLESYSEVEKTFSHQTYQPNQDNDEIAHYLTKASLHYVDNNFMRARRRVSQFERGIPSSASERRIWYGRSFYRPDLVKKTALILTTYLNYCVANNGNTPAQRLGITKGAVRLKDILNS